MIRASENPIGFPVSLDKAGYETLISKGDTLGWRV